MSDTARGLPSEGEQPPADSPCPECHRFCNIFCPNRTYHLGRPLTMSKSPRAPVAPTATSIDPEACVVESVGEHDLRCLMHNETFARVGFIPLTCLNTQWVTPKRMAEWREREAAFHREQAAISAPPEAGAETRPGFESIGYRACVECLKCGFQFAACHTLDTGGYSCPVCAESSLTAERPQLVAVIYNAHTYRPYCRRTACKCAYCAEYRAALTPESP